MSQTPSFPTNHKSKRNSANKNQFRQTSGELSGNLRGPSGNPRGPPGALFQHPVSVKFGKSWPKLGLPSSRWPKSPNHGFDFVGGVLPDSWGNLRKSVFGTMFALCCWGAGFCRFGCDVQSWRKIRANRGEIPPRTHPHTQISAEKQNSGTYAGKLHNRRSDPREGPWRPKWPPAQRAPLKLAGPHLKESWRETGRACRRRASDASGQCAISARAPGFDQPPAHGGLGGHSVGSLDENAPRTAMAKATAPPHLNARPGSLPLANTMFIELATQSVVIPDIEQCGASSALSCRAFNKGSHATELSKRRNAPTPNEFNSIKKRSSMSSIWHTPVYGRGADQSARPTR